MENFTNIKVNRLSDDLHHIVFENGKELYLIGTAHVSAESVKVVEEVITEQKPEMIAVELDKQRLEVMKNRKKYEETDLVEIIKKRKTIFFIAQLLLSSYQKRIAQKLGVKPGAEFKMGVELSESSGAELVLADRNIGITLKRITRSLSFWDKSKLFSSLLFSEKSDTDISEEEIQRIKEKDNLTALIGELGDEMPVIKKILLDERNEYLAKEIYDNLKQKSVAIVGAAHVPGILECLDKSAQKISLENLNEIPPRSLFFKILPWIFPLIIIALFIKGFFGGNTEGLSDAAFYWILINGTLTALGCLLALGHPVTIAVGFIASPITSLNPTIGAGMVTGLVQLFLVKPKVKDIETAGEDANKIKGWWQNRLMRTLLVSLFSSIGSSIGSFAAFPFIMKLLG